MELNDQTLANSKAFATKLRGIKDKIAAGSFQIDGSGDTLRSVVGMVVQTLGTESYDTAKPKIDAAKGEQAQVAALLESVVDQIDQINVMQDSTLGILKQFGASGIKWV